MLNNLLLPQAVKWLFCLSIILLIFNVQYGYSTALKSVALKHRDAQDIHQVILPLLPEGTSASIDNNVVIINGTPAVVNNIVRVIKALDRPQVRLKVSVYRGKYPEQSSVKSYTTNAGINRSQIVYTEEGQTIVVTEQNLVKIPIEHSYYHNNAGVAANSNVPLVPNKGLQIVTNDGVLEALDIPVVDEDEEGLNVATINSTDISKGELANTQKNHLQTVQTGLYLRVTLQGKNRNGEQQARVGIKSVHIPEALLAEKTKTHDLDVQNFAVSSSIEVISTLIVGQWMLLSEQNTLSHQLPLNNKSKVYSTQTSSDSQESLWVKVELAD